MHVPVFGEERYTLTENKLQKIKKEWSVATWVDGKQPGGGGVGSGVICGYTNIWRRLKTTYMWPQSTNKNLII